jgi:hypothetical protein
MLAKPDDMSSISDPRFDGIDFENSYLTGVIYDDESLTLEMDFNLSERHPQYAVPQDGDESCYRGGYIRFSDIEDLQIEKAPEQADDYSIVYSVAGDGRRFEFSSGWGQVKVTAGSVRLALD